MCGSGTTRRARRRPTICAASWPRKGSRAHQYEALKTSLDGWCRLEDTSDLARTLRLVKSPAELAYVRRAAALANASLTAMLDTAGPGAFEGDIAAAGQAAILSGGGDVAPSGPVLGSGERALLVRSATGYRTLDAVDQLTLEFAASYRHYCACLMRTVAIGSGSDAHRAMFSVTTDALAAMTDAARAGRPLASRLAGPPAGPPAGWLARLARLARPAARPSPRAAQQDLQ